MRETYTNNGNRDIPDNPKLKKNEFFDRQFVDNELPGEYFDIRENVLECDLNDDDKYAYDPGKENGSAEPNTSLDDVKDLTNVVSTPTHAIVESAGTIATSTATVVVGAAAAVVAFNATSKVQPKMIVNRLDSGSSFVHYNLTIENLELDKDYDIIVRNGQQEVKIDLVKEGENDEYVYNLKPGLQYSLSLVSYNELLGEIEYAKETFYTLNSEEIVGYSNIEVIYNDDLTCGIKYDTTLVDDMNALTDTYIIVKSLQRHGESQGEDWDLFDSLYAEEYTIEQPGLYTYEYKNKVHKGSIGYVPPGMLRIELYEMGPEGEEWNGRLIATTEKEIVYPLYEETQSNLVEFSGDYNLIKDIKKINVKKDNLVVKMTLYNERDVETKIEKEIDISQGLFDFKQLVKQDTNGYSYQIGYYKADKTFVVIKESEKQEFYGGYFGAYYNDISSNYGLMKANWNYDESGNETLDLTLLTDFDNYGNDDCYYKVEIFKEVHNSQTGDTTYELIDTYTGTGLPTFKNLPTTEYDPSYGINVPIYYGFKYTSIMNYYDGNDGKVAVEMEERDHTSWNVSFEPQFSISATQFAIRGDGKFQIPLDANMETSYAGQMLYEEGTITLYFEKTYGVVDQTVTINATIEPESSDLLLVFDGDLPTGMVTYSIACDIPYIGLFNETSGRRRFVIKDPFTMGDVHYSAEVSSVRMSIADEMCTGTAEAYAYIPDGGYVAATYDNADDTYARLTKNSNGKYVFNFTELDVAQYLRFVIFDKYDEELAQGSLYLFDQPKYDINYDHVDLHNTDGNYYSVMTYNDDGTVNIYCITGLSKSSSYSTTNFTVNCYLESYDNNTGEYVEIDSVMGVTERQQIAVFKNVPYDQYDATFNIIYELVYDHTDEYSKTRQVVASSICEFQLIESNLNTLHPNGQLMGYVSYNEELGQDVIGLTIPTGMMYDKNQTVRFEAYVSADDDPIEITGKLSDYFDSSDSNGDYYIFDIDSSAVVGGSIFLYMNYNYTLTEEKYNMIKNIYSGNLYRSYSIMVTQV